jgi:hypothetical protein
MKKVKESSKEGEYGWCIFYTRINIEYLNCWNHHKKGTKGERKNEGMNQFGLSYLYAWKYHDEIPGLAILNK